MEHSYLGIHVGMSPHHSRNVALAHDSIMGHTSPQFHVAFDEGFQTIAAGRSKATDAKLEALLDKPQKSSSWSHSDEHADHGEHYFLDHIWSNDPMSSKD